MFCKCNSFVLLPCTIITNHLLKSLIIACLLDSWLTNNGDSNYSNTSLQLCVIHNYSAHQTLQSHMHFQLLWQNVILS